MYSEKEIIKYSTIKEQVYMIIKDNIIKGTLKPGEWLSENKIAQSLNVSRSPVREALKELSGEGLLENVPNKGVFVKVLGVKDVYDIFEFREIVESYAIKKAIDLITDEDITVLNQIGSELLSSYKSKDINEYCKSDTKLHDYIFIMSDNKIIYEIVNNVFPLVQPFRILSLNNKTRLEESLEEHLSIIKAIKEKDLTMALKLNKMHLELAKDGIIKHLESINK